MKRTKSTKRLQLTKETLRALSSKALEGVVGGSLGPTLSCDCTSYCDKKNQAFDADEN